MKYPELSCVLLVTRDHPHYDNSLGALGVDFPVQTSTKDQQAFFPVVQSQQEGLEASEGATPHHRPV